jgi:hypothetical protein
MRGSKIHCLDRRAHLAVVGILLLHLLRFRFIFLSSARNLNLAGNFNPVSQYVLL